MTDWLLDHGIRIALIVVVAVLAVWLARRILPRVVARAVSADTTADITLSTALEEQRRRGLTLGRVVVWVTTVILVAVAFLLVLGEVGIPLGPLIAGAGVVGIAVGFGAQSLVKDTLAGFFILLENQYGAGDVVRVAGIAGTVETINLRRTILRDLDGVMHTIPNGEITVASNMTRGWSRVNLNVSVGYGEDLDRVRAVIDGVGQSLAADPDWSDRILEAPRVLRVDAFEDSGVALKVLGRTKPTMQWEVAGELRRRIKMAFDEEGIEIPFPHRVYVLRHENGEPFADAGGAAEDGFTKAQGED